MILPCKLLTCGLTPLLQVLELSDTVLQLQAELRDSNQVVLQMRGQMAELEKALEGAEAAANIAANECVDLQEVGMDSCGSVDGLQGCLLPSLHSSTHLGPSVTENNSPCPSTRRRFTSWRRARRAPASSSRRGLCC